MRNVSEVMIGVSGSIQRHELNAANLDDSSIFRHKDTIFWHRKELAPSNVHFVAVYLGGAGEQFFRIDQVWGALGVDVNASAATRQPACRSSVIQVNVGDQNVGNVFDTITVGLHTGDERRNGGGRTGFDQDCASVVGNQVSSDGSGNTGESEVYGLNWWSNLSRIAVSFYHLTNPLSLRFGYVETMRFEPLSILILLHIALAFHHPVSGCFQKPSIKPDCKLAYCAKMEYLDLKG